MSLVTTVQQIGSALELRQGPSGPPGPPGPPGGAGAAYTAAAVVSGHQAVALDSAGQAFYASAGTLSHALRVAGVSLNAAAIGEEVTVLAAGLVDHGGWTWTPDQPVYLGLNGALVQSVPVGAVFALVVGKALSATRLLVALQPPIVLT